jgi:ABC-type multidrug transport system ATPase subunit
MAGVPLGTESIPSAAVKTIGLTKRFGRFTALKAIDLSVQPGESIVFLGANGAGKTTLLRALGGLSRPTDGQIYLNGYPLRRDDITVRRQLGVLLTQTLLYADLTLEENLRFYGRMYAVRGLDERLQTVVRQLGLERWQHERLRMFSNGMQRRAALARCLLHSPTILLLDEPENGLDREGQQLMVDLALDWHRQGCTLLVATHDVQLGLAMCGRVAVLSKGRLAQDCSRDEYRQVLEQTNSGSLVYG